MTKHLSIPILIVAALSACSAADEGVPERVGTVSQSVITNCEYLDPSMWAPLSTAVDFDRELVIRDVSVVDDACRTEWTSSCSGASRGHWTFGFLMQEMAGGLPPHEFVAHWLHSMHAGWSSVPSPGPGFTVPPRLDMYSELIDPWLQASGCPPGSMLVGPSACPLDLTQAPFRLLAIVNRLDFADASTSPPEQGEMRFVFTSYNPNLPAPQPPHQATYIFEYSYPTSRTVFDWATDVHALSGMAMGSPSYLAHLQSLTDAVVMRGAEPGNPNFGSAIAQIRTNEEAFDLTSTDWTLREFNLTLWPPGGFDEQLMLPTTTKQTPHNSRMGSLQLNMWLNANRFLIETLDHSVPTYIGTSPLMGGDSIADGVFFWQHTTGALTPLQRHMFGFATCNGCHNLDTNTPGFVHIAPRNVGVAAPLSGFLGVSPNPSSTSPGLPANTFPVPDPASAVTFDYNEPWRRVCEHTRLLNGVAAPYTNAAGVH